MHITVGADAVWAEDSGGQGEPVVLLHPGVGDSRIWNRVWPRLTPRRRAVRYDVRGYGRSAPATEPYVLVEDLNRVLDALGVNAVHLVGCSMGGATALDLALAAPGRVRSLTLLCPAVTGYPWPPEPELDAAVERLQARGDEEALVRLSLETWGAAGGTPEVVEQLHSASRAWPNEAAYQRPPMNLAFDRLGGVEAPTVLVVGSLDWPALIECNEEIARRIAGCRLVRTAGVDHFPPLRIPEVIASLVLKQTAQRR